MADQDSVFVPATPYNEAKETGRFSRFEPGTRILNAGFRYGKQYMPLPVDIVFEKDTAVTLRDGTTIYVDVLRPVGEGRFPVIIAWSPYGKSRGGIGSASTMRRRLGIDESRLSGLMKWEGPDPGFWCAHGYAVCHPDARGAFNSGGDIQLFGEQEGRDGHDLVEWLAEQPWCSGKVGLSGNSWLTVAQWFIAAERPPHLAAIAPWEGFSDLYRDVLLRGGMPDPAMAYAMMKLNFTGKQRMENGALAIERYPLLNDYWRAKIPRLTDITVPAYVVASYTNTFHTAGTFRAWERISSTQKWLRIHNRMEWPDYYAEDSLRDLQRFFDHFLKGEENGWQGTARVRYALLDLHGHDVVNRPATQFPPPQTTNTPFYLDSTTSRLVHDLPEDAGTHAYDARSRTGRAEFTIRFDEQTQIIGYPKVKLWVQADGADDMDLFVFLQKLDRHGKHLMVQTTDTKSPMIRLVTHFGASLLKYKASTGRLRVSLRRLDEHQSTDTVPTHAFDTVDKLRVGQIVNVEIPLVPVGLLIHPGEQLRLVVSGRNLVGAAMPAVSGDVKPDNHGHHVIHTGGAYDSYLQLPIHPATS